MSWGPRARSDYRFRKMATRAMMRDARRRRTPLDNPGPRPRLAPNLTPLPYGTRRSAGRDEAYARGARTLIFWTAAAWVVCIFVGATQLVGVGLVLIMIESVVWAIYQAQFNAARRHRESTADIIAPDLLGVSDIDSNTLVAQAGQTAFRAADAEKAALRKAETVCKHLLDKQGQDATRAKIGKGVADWEASQQDAARRQAVASQQFRAKVKAQQEVLDQELRWRRDAKHGNFGQGIVGEHDLNQKVADMKPSIETQLQELERKVKDGLPRTEPSHHPQ